MQPVEFYAWAELTLDVLLSISVFHLGGKTQHMVACFELFNASVPLRIIQWFK